MERAWIHRNGLLDRDKGEAGNLPKHTPTVPPASSATFLPLPGTRLPAFGNESNASNDSVNVFYYSDMKHKHTIAQV